MMALIFLGALVFVCRAVATPETLAAARARQKPFNKWALGFIVLALLSFIIPAP